MGKPTSTGPAWKPPKPEAGGSIALIVGGLAILLGRVTKTIPAPITAAIGGWLEQFGWGIGVIAGLWFFFTGGKLPWS